MYKVQVVPVGTNNMWEYHIVFEKNGHQHTIGKGYRTTEQAARMDGAADMRLARSFGIGLYAS